MCDQSRSGWHASAALTEAVTRPPLSHYSLAVLPITSPPSKTTHVLVVEDDRDIRELLVELIEDTGYSVHAEPDGAGALTFLRDHRPRLVLLDINMPGVDGLTVIEELRQNRGLSQVSIVAITGGPSASVPFGIGFLQKPFDRDAVVDLVESHCKESQLS